MSVFMINIRKLLVCWFLIVGIALSQVYDVGDTISEEHQNIVFEQCYGIDEDGEIRLADYQGKVLWIEMSASWSSPSFDGIQEIDDIVYEWFDNENVAFFHYQI